MTSLDDALSWFDILNTKWLYWFSEIVKYLGNKPKKHTKKSRSLLGYSLTFQQSKLVTSIFLRENQLTVEIVEYRKLRNFSKKKKKIEKFKLLKKFSRKGNILENFLFWKKILRKY